MRFKALEVLLDLPEHESTLKLGALIAGSLEDSIAIALLGNLGAGKTTLVQGMASELQISEPVASPTFLMLNEYQSGLLPVFHFDLYRLQEDLSPDSAAAFNLKSELDEFMLSREPVLVIVEWANLWEDFLSGYEKLRVELEYSDSGRQRSARLSAQGLGAESLLERCREKLAGEKGIQFVNK